jgi:hypothetical protein
MADLATLQRWFWQTVRGEPLRPEREAAWVGTPEFPVAARMSVYRTAYWARQVHVLREVFPRVVAHLQDGPFARAASRFIGAHPSRSAEIEQLGHGFAAWLAVEHGDALGELAAFEWAMWQVSIAPDVAAVPMSAAGAPSFASSALQLGPQVQRVPASPWLLAELGHTAPDHAWTAIAVWRAGFAVFRRPVTAVEDSAMARANIGASVIELCDLLADGGGDAAFVFASLAAWFHHGWVASISNQGNV